MPRLFTGSVVLELLAVLANVIHVLQFTSNGVGHPSLAAFGDIMDIAARVLCSLIHFYNYEQLQISEIYNKTNKCVVLCRRSLC